MPLFYLNHLSQVLTEGEEWSPLLRQRPLFGGGAGAFLPRGASAAAINRALSEPYTCRKTSVSTVAKV